MSIQNISENTYTSTETDINKNIERLSSGKSINSGADDPAKLVEVNRSTALVTSKMKEVENESTSISMNQVKDAGLTQITDNLQQIRDLVAESKNSSYDTTEKNAIQKQVNELVGSTQSVVDNTRFGNTQLIEPQDKLQTALKGISTSDDLSKIDAVIKEVSNQKADTGTQIQASTSAINNSLAEIENQNAGLSRLQDTDMAQNMAELIKEQIKIQGTTNTIKNIMHLNASKVEQLLN